MLYQSDEILHLQKKKKNVLPYFICINIVGSLLNKNKPIKLFHNNRTFERKLKPYTKPTDPRSISFEPLKVNVLTSMKIENFSPFFSCTHKSLALWDLLKYFVIEKNMVLEKTYLINLRYYET